MSGGRCNSNPYYIRDSGLFCQLENGDWLSTEVLKQYGIFAMWKSCYRVVCRWYTNVMCIYEAEQCSWSVVVALVSLRHCSEWVTDMICQLLEVSVKATSKCNTFNINPAMDSNITQMSSFKRQEDLPLILSCCEAIHWDRYPDMIIHFVTASYQMEPTTAIYRKVVKSTEATQLMQSNTFSMPATLVDSNVCHFCLSRHVLFHLVSIIETGLQFHGLTFELSQ